MLATYSSSQKTCRINLRRNSRYDEYALPPQDPQCLIAKTSPFGEKVTWFTVSLWPVSIPPHEHPSLSMSALATASSGSTKWRNVVRPARSTPSRHARLYVEDNRQGPGCCVPQSRGAVSRGRQYDTSNTRRERDFVHLRRREWPERTANAAPVATSQISMTHSAGFLVHSSS